MTIAIPTTEEIQELPYEQRMDLLCNVLDGFPFKGGHIALDKIEPGASVLALSSMIHSGGTTGVSASTYTHFQPQRLVLLEPRQMRFCATERGTTVTEMLWWKKTRENFNVTREYRQIPRSLWRVHGMFFGTTNLFPRAPTEEGLCSGDAFGWENPIVLDAPVCPPGLSFTVHVSHSLDEIVEFRALLFGKRVAPESVYAPELPGRLPTVPYMCYPPGSCAISSYTSWRAPRFSWGSP